MHTGKMTIATTIATLTVLLTGVRQSGSSPLASARTTQSAIPTAQSTGTGWAPTWNTAPDKSKAEKTQLRPTLRLAEDGFRGSPVFRDSDRKNKNAQTREAFVRSLPSIPECAGIVLQPGNSEETDFVLQLFNGIDGRSGRLQWVLYRTDTMGERAHGEGTGDGIEIAITRDVCSTIRAAVSPEPHNAEPVSSSTAEIHPSLDEWKASFQSVETRFSQFHYRLPQGFTTLPDDIRRKENLNQYQAQRAEELRKQGAAYESRRSEDGRQVTTTNKTEIYTDYTLLLATRTAPTTGKTDQLPRANVHAHKRVTMLMEAGDPAKFVMYVPQVKVLRGPEDVMLSGRTFVRTDFKFKSGDYLSKFCTVQGGYLFEFDFRADNENDLGELVQSMQSIVFRP
jgi:hypothetical protein